MFARRNASAERLGLRNIKRREIDEARAAMKGANPMTEAQRKRLSQQRDREAAATEAMLEAMRCLGFEAICQTFTGHVLGRPDVTPMQVHDELQRLARCAWAEIPAGEV